MPILTPEETLRIKLKKLQEEHSDLHLAIDAMQQTGVKDQLAISRLKKRKLCLKDEIAQVEDRLYPDIIA